MAVITIAGLQIIKGFQFSVASGQGPGARGQFPGHRFRS
jgi:hypothetical protein